MTVVEKRERNGSRDQFPIGMRVLAVDDDPTCLKVLETLLLRCQYHVKTTNHAIKALNMLRENKDQFDLVISDVHMPDMDGFKLLEIVGLEMDLPVIMLSANGETQAVMKGISHGACDYLLKPVRIEELKNIWQHVIRRKKFDPRDQNNLDSWEDGEKPQLANSDGVQGSSGNESSDRNAKSNRKRKDQNEDDEDDGEDNSNENEDPSAQKKPRVVWSVELHRKFVAAVNQLGIDKAVPKRILDLMNVERLTRENVASHLQKYRLYLKRLSAVANQQANMVAALRSRDPSYLPMGSLDGYANFNSLVGNRQLPNRAPFSSNGAVPRMNSFTGFGLHGFVSSGTSQLNRTLNNTSSSINDISKLQGIGLQSLQGNQQGSALIQGMPTSLELDKLQKTKPVQEVASHLYNGFSVGQSANSFTNTTKTSNLLQGNQLQTESAGLSNQSSVRIPSLSSDPFGISVGDSSNSVDLTRCSETWHGAIPSTSYSANTLSMNIPFSHNDLSSSNIGDNICPVVSQLGSNPRGAPCSSAAMVRNDTLANAQNPASSLVAASVNGDANLLNFGSFGNSNLQWEEPKQGQSQNPSLSCGSYPNSSVLNIHTSSKNSGNQTLGNGFANRKMDMSGIRQPSFGAPFLTQDPKSDRINTAGHLLYKDEPFSDDLNLQGGFGSGGFGLDDVVGNGIIKPECDDFGFIDGDIGCNDIYSLGACM